MNDARSAAFLDRDGTIIREGDYLADPEQVELVPGAAAAIRRFADEGYAVIIVTNQSGIARGLYTVDQFRAVQRRVEDELAANGASVDAVFHCPHHPQFTGPCECRKPGLGMFRDAARALRIDLASSIYVGDRITDVLPAIATGGRGFLVRTGYGQAEANAVPEGIRVVADLSAVVDAVFHSVDTRQRPE